MPSSKQLSESAEPDLRERDDASVRIDAERYRYFVEQTAEGFYRIDFEPPIPIDLPHDELIARMYDAGFVRECNQVFAKTYGFRSAIEMEGTSLAELHGGTDVPENIEALRKFIDDGFRHFGVETVETSIDGKIVYLMNNSVGIIEDGFYVSCWGNQRDITEQRVAEHLVNRSREQLRALLGRLQRAQEDERTRVSREIHDQLGQLLTGLKMDVSWLERKLSEPGLSPSLNALLERAVAASELVDQTIESVQKIAADLRPVGLDQLGLASALAASARQFQERSDILCSLHVEDPRQEIPADTSNELFYICQEALTNVARHAKPTRVEIRLHAGEDEIILEIQDDGLGIDEAKSNAASSLGLLGMRERALQLGGTVGVQRLEPSGTLVVARVPGAARSLHAGKGGTA